MSEPTPSTFGSAFALEHKRVIVTRARHQASEMCRLLEARGAEAIVMPTIAIGLPADPSPLRHAVAQVERYDRLILTSVNAVRALSDALADAGLSRSALTAVSIHSVGPGTTRALESLGIRVDQQAQTYQAEGLLEQLPAEEVRGKRILLLRAKEAREVLPETLRDRGATVDVVVAYVTTLAPPELWAQGLAALRARQVDAIALTSGSTARNLKQIVGAELLSLLEGVVVAVIGQVTAAACAELGFRVDVVPEQQTVSALVDALSRYFVRSQQPLG